jgi:ankyrin repeat protein
MGLPADAQLSWFLQAPPRQFYLDMTNPAHLPGQGHLDNFVVTREFASVNRDFAKTHASPDTDGNSPYHRAVMVNSLLQWALDNIQKN